ncbi:GDSL esterase/lipase At3g48460-like [Cynara cardunculus var. scolymus]|uniref:GDSL esterase/lipase At3g48460-like n=1 Tax=Cynara cardunculus var. scolymus TaxID=59895 RepID=UPI000D62AF5A|nr:GDSL esterase/lipase At3g48460-like [Cynara cardunculus var. scolymus]
MYSFHLSQFTLITICISIFLLSPLSLASPKPHPFKKVYVFGDSYTDTGSGNSSTGPSIFRHVSSLPYGETFFRRPTNRYSDGRVFIDFVAESLNLPYFPPYLNKSSDTTHGVNFAVSGCTAIPYPFFVKNNLTSNIIPQSLPTQLTWFKDFIKGSGCNDAVSTPAECKAVFDGALVWVGEISANDYNYVYGSHVTSKTVQKLAIKYQTRFMKEILKMGAKYVVVQGLPATGCFPLSLVALAPPTDRDEMGCVATKNKESYDHNVVLQAKLRSLRKEFPATVIVYGDDWHAYREVYGNPAKYGFTERFKACCGVKDGAYDFNPMCTCGAPGTSSCKNPARYMNWDGLHVTEGLNRATSRLFLGGAFAQPPFPYLLKKAAQS